MNAAQRLPAFAADLAAARRRGMTLRDPTVSVALHWRNRPGVGYGVVIPDDMLPDALDWSWARDLEVIIFRRGDSSERVMNAIAAIERGKPKRLLVVDVGPVDSNVISIVCPDEDAARV